nr:hypothetical protein [Tanacetum cinerariifolium]
MVKIFDVMGCEDVFKTRLAVYKFKGNALAWWKAYKQAKDAAGTAEEQAKNFQWGLCRQKSGDRHQPTTQQSSHRNHSHNNDRHGSDRRGSGDNHHSNNNYSGNNNGLNFKSIQSSSTHKHDPNITVPSSPGVPLRATLTRSALCVDADTQGSVVELLVPCFKCGQTGHLQKDCKKNTTASTSVADALSRKLGMIAGIKVEKEIIRDLERLDIELYVHGQHGY